MTPDDAQDLVTAPALLEFTARGRLDEHQVVDHA
jgi:hypothetical protein